jgi:sugar (pentulose or hexulose) kinase
MSDDHPVFLGIDVGTGSVRVLAVTDCGERLARSSVPLETKNTASHPDFHEQEVTPWWDCVSEACRLVVSELEGAGVALDRLQALAVDGTSGTLVCLDETGAPVRSALMYNDNRAVTEAEQLTAAAPEFCDKLGYRFEASFALAKIAWIERHEPDIARQTKSFAHQADYITGLLTGEPITADYSNALKTGYDLVDERWPDWIQAHLPAVMDKLPVVVPPGTPIGCISRFAAARTGIPAGVPVIAGASDGVAATLASGVHSPGDYNTTLGTTLVFKGVSDCICKDPGGLIYSHKLPGGVWLPGAASNTGAAWIKELYQDEDLHTLDEQSLEHLPSSCVAYPLVRRGERFPFLSPTAEGFCDPKPSGTVERFAAYLQGVALLERRCYEILDRTTGSGGGQVYATGGGSVSDIWMQLRATVSNRVFHRPMSPESSLGSAILAATGTFFPKLADAVKSMVKFDRTFHPEARYRDEYDAIYLRFCRLLEDRGYR